MNRYRFRLERVLHVRRAQEDLAKAGLLRARWQLARVEREVAERLDRYRELPARAGAQATEPYLAGRARLQFAAAAVLAAGVERQLAMEAVAAAAATWSAAATRVQALERLDERRRAEHAREQERGEERATDDLVTSRARREERGVRR